MVFLMTTVVCALVAWVAAPGIRRWPGVLYGVAIALDAFLLLGAFSLVPGQAARFAMMLMRRGILALALFAAVMFIGVLPPGSSARVRLGSIRAELSIAACIVAAAHIAVNLGVFLPRFLQPGMPVPLAVSFAIAAVLLVLLLLLGVTSFSFVKERMDARRWKALQRLSYLFFGLVFAHIAFVLGPAALSGSGQARMNVIAYLAVFVLYVVLRVARALRDRSHGKNLAQR